MIFWYNRPRRELLPIVHLPRSLKSRNTRICLNIWQMPILFTFDCLILSSVVTCRQTIIVGPKTVGSKEQINYVIPKTHLIYFRKMLLPGICQLSLSKKQNNSALKNRIYSLSVQMIHDGNKCFTYDLSE